MRNLCVSLRSIFPDPHPSLPPFRRSPSSDSIPPPPPFPPLTRSLSLDRSFLKPPPPASAPAQLPQPRPRPAAPDSQACSPAIPAGDAAENARESQPAQPPLDDVNLADPPPLALVDSVNSTDCSSTSLEPTKSSDEDDGSIAWRLFGKGWECAAPGNGAWDDLAVGKPVQKSLGNCRKIKMHHCTEALGSESSDAHEDVSSFDSLGEFKSGITISEAEWKPADNLMQQQATRQPVLADENGSHCDNKELRSLGHKRKFPPPLTLYSSASACQHHPSSDDSFSLSLRPYRKNGRFVLEEVRVPCRQYLRASRKDGRLRLDLVAQTYNDDFARAQIYRNDLLEEEAELEITSQGEEWEVAQTAADTDLGSENYQDDVEEIEKESESQMTRTQPMIPIPKKMKTCIGETSSSSDSVVGEKQLFLVASESETEVMDSPIATLTAGLSRSKRKVEQLSISNNKVEPHQARSLPCGRCNLSAPLMNGDPLSPSSYSVSQGSLKQQTLACHDMSSPLLSDQKPCRSVDRSNDNFSEKKLLLNCYLSGGVLPRTCKMNRTIAGRLEEGSRVLKFFGLEEGNGSEERMGKNRRRASFDGARSLPSPCEWDFQISFAGIYAALRRHDSLHTLPCKKELEVSELDKCLKLHLVATNS